MSRTERHFQLFIFPEGETEKKSKGKDLKVSVVMRDLRFFWICIQGFYTQYVFSFFFFFFSAVRQNLTSCNTFINKFYEMILHEWIGLLTSYNKALFKKQKKQNNNNNSFLLQVKEKQGKADNKLDAPSTTPKLSELLSMTLNSTVAIGSVHSCRFISHLFAFSCFPRFQREERRQSSKSKWSVKMCHHE